MTLSIYKKNHTALEQYHPELLALTDNNTNAQNMFDTKSEGKRLGGSLALLNDEDNTKSNVSNDISDTYQQIHLVPPPKYLEFIPSKYQILYGMGLGKWILQHYQNQNPPPYRLIIVEPNKAVFHNAMHTVDFSDLITHPRVTWCIGDELKSLEKQLRDDIAAIGSWGIQVYVNCDATEQYKEHYDSRKNLIQNITSLAYENAQIQIQNGAAMQLNIICNLPAMFRSHSLDALQNTMKNIPAIVIGAGPSLDKNIHHLKNVAPGTLLIAVDTVLATLRNNEIEPHIVVSCDPTDLNYKHFETIDSLGEILFAFLPETCHNVISKYSKHPHLVCLHDWQSKTLQSLSSYLPKSQPFQRGMNVGFCAFSLATHLGCSPIVLAGMDLALPKRGQSHAKGSANAVQIDMSKEKERSKEKSESYIQVEGYYGEPVYTYAYFKHVLQRFNSMIPETNATVIDATEGGAKKAGCIQQSLEYTLRDLPAGQEFRISERLPQKEKHLSKEAIQSVINLAQGMAEVYQQLKNGKQKLNELRRKQKAPKNDPSELLQQTQSFLERWDALLESPELDLALDIALAQWRFAYRQTFPLSAGEREQARQWQMFLKLWFESLIHTIERIMISYQQTIQELENDLTSNHTRQ